LIANIKLLDEKPARPMLGLDRRLNNSDSISRSSLGSSESYASSGFQAASIEWLGPFKEPSREHAVTKSSIDFSRLTVVVFAVNFLPAVLLWRYEEVVAWL
jgi:hypothetical protein